MNEGLSERIIGPSVVVDCIAVRFDGLIPESSRLGITG